MEQLIDFHAPEVQAVLDTLLKDKSTGKNIIWATDPPEELQTVMYEPVTDRSQITTQQLGLTHYEVVLPRMMKQTDTQQQRTRKKGEVFSPAWVCNKMNNALDADWFRGLGAEESAGQFTVELPQGWQTVETPVQFPACGGKTPAWVQYVQSRRLEVTCGEAPFLASRYDAATGEMIPVARRIGILDRKLRVVSENAATEDEWRKYATHAVQSTYGYEYQGDNLLLARVNLLLTYAEHLQARWQRKPTKEELQPIATIISWNLWQMDGLRLSVPGGKPQPEAEQLDLFSMFGAAEPQPPTVSCKVKNWRKGSHGTTQNFETIQEGSTSMKFDYVIGNPPYQDEMEGTSDNPVYNLFMDATYPMASVVELITPARFLFNAGKTPKTWNEKMLNQTLKGCEAPAAGWVKELELEDGQIKAVVEWMPRGAQYLENKEYRYLSPVVNVRKADNKAIGLHSLALTNTPAIEGMNPIVNSDNFEGGQHSMDIKKLAELLGLSEDATEEQVVEALKVCLAENRSLKETEKQPPENVVANKAVCELLGLKAGAAAEDVTAKIMELKSGTVDGVNLAEELKALKQQNAEREANDAVILALKAGKITPAQKEWAKSYALSDPKGFGSFVEKAPQIVPMDKIELDDVKALKSDALDADTLLVCKQLGISPDDVKKYGMKED